MPKLRPPKVYYRFSRLEASRLKRHMLFIAGGVGVGLAAVLMAWAADRAQSLFREVAAISPYLPFVVTPLGFALSCFLARTLFPGSQGSGIPQVIAARKLDPGAPRHHLVSLRIAAGKIILMLLGLVTGGSLGREGPTVQVGAAIMQAAGRLAPMKQPGYLLAGGAAGVAAAFNTPLAGIVFAIEELSKSFDAKASGIVLVTVIVAGLTAEAVLGNYTYFGVFDLMLAPDAQWLAVPVVAVVGGLMGGIFNRLNVTYARGLPGIAGALIRRFPVLTAALLGLVVAGAGYLSGTQVAGTGYEAARAALEGSSDTTSIWFGPAKFVATLASTLSGIPGGVFSPSLAIGAGFGVDVAQMLSIETVSAFALLGMVAYLTGVIQAPITAFVIVSEMTDNHAMLLPLMLTALIANWVSRGVAEEGLYHALARGFVARAAAPPATTAAG